MDLCSLALPIGLTRSLRSRDYKIVGSWILGRFLGARLGNLFVDFRGFFSTSDLGRVGGASEDVCGRFSDTPVAVFRTHPCPFFGHTCGRFPT